jgi:hypothetical protein
MELKEDEVDAIMNELAENKKYLTEKDFEKIFPELCKKDKEDKEDEDEGGMCTLI